MHKNLLLLLLAVLLCSTVVVKSQDSKKIDDLIALARIDFNVENYRAALEKIEQIENIPGGAAKPAVAHMKIISYYRIKEYQKCIDAADNYLSGMPEQDHTLSEIRKARADSQQLLDEINKSFKLGKEAAEKAHIELMNNHFDKYKSLLPDGDKIDEIKKITCETYYKQAVTWSKEKQLDLLEKSTKYFEIAKNICTNKPDINTYIQSNNNRMKNFKRTDISFWGYTGDSKSLAGMTFGKIKQNNVGWYFAVRLTPKWVYPYFAMIEEMQQYDDTGTLLNQKYDFEYEWDPPSDINIKAALGATYKIIQPLWCYLGGGISNDNEIRWFTRTQNSNRTLAKNVDKKRIAFLIDAGLMVNIPGFTISAGICHDMKKAFPTFGIQRAF